MIIRIPRFLRLAAFTGAMASLFATPGHAQTAAAVSTFHAIGLYWKPAVADPANPPVCKVEYRPNAAGPWFEGMPLWFDNNPPTFTGKFSGVTGTTPVPRDSARVQEYRGSIVDLEPNTQYEIKLTLQPAGASVTLNGTTTRTMNENFAVQGVIPVTSRSTPYTINSGGSTATGYLVYDGAGGGAGGVNAVIDLGSDHANDCVTINAGYVILRNFTIRNGQNGVRLGDVKNVVVEQCDIAGWGEFTLDATGNFTALGKDGHSGIFAQSAVLEHVVIQRNKIHDPRTRANSWGTGYLQNGAVGGPPGGKHPSGPMGINFLGNGQANGYKGTAGHHIIRYNEIWSLDGQGDVQYNINGHAFDDGIGGDQNQSLAGFPGRDSDIYGNYIANCWDDGIEAEGGGMNVRLWGNYVEYTFQAFAHAGNSYGPLYSFRNLAGFRRENPQKTTDPTIDTESAPYPSGGSGYKLGWDNTSPDFGKGRLNILHNTLLQPVFTSGAYSRPAGAVNGINGISGKVLTNLYSRNNILEIKDAGASARMDMAWWEEPGNDLNRDLANGIFKLSANDEINAIIGVATYASTPTSPTVANGTRQPNAFAQTSSSPGYNTAYVQKNFGDFFNNNGGPDIGAVEAGMGTMVFGVTANWTTFLDGTPSDTTAPSVPTGLASNAITSTSFTLSWTASTDNVGVTGYEVFRDGVSIATPSGTSTSVTGLTASTTYSMKVRARDAVPNWSAQSTALSVTTTAGGSTPPAFTTQPVSQTVNVGASVTFTSAASGTPTPTYQWRKNGANIASATAANYTIASVTAADAGNYSVVASNSAGNATSSTAVLTVNSVPIITTTTLPAATLNTAYSQTLAATGGNGALTWSLASGALPAGVSLASTTGVISGMPTADGVFTVTARVADADGITGPSDEDTQVLTLTVNPADNTLGTFNFPVNPPSPVTRGNTYIITVPYGASSSGTLNRVVDVALRDNGGPVVVGPVSVTVPSAAAGSVGVSITIPAGLAPATNYKWRMRLKAPTGFVTAEVNISGVTVQ